MKKLIEVSFPLEAINREATREKSVRHGHPSTLHLWWARRPLAAMRAAIFASLVTAPYDETDTKKLQELIAGLSEWDQISDGDNQTIDEAKKLIWQNFPEKAPKILDPFMGSGSTGLEALRLGCETYGTEYNPVAHLIELCTLIYPHKYSQFGTDGDQLGDQIKKWGNWVTTQVQAEIGYLYKDPINGAPIIGYLWARTIPCSNPTCGALIPLVRNWWLANKAKRKIALHPVVQDNSKKLFFEIINAELSTVGFDPSQGTFSRGTFQCPVCNSISSNQILSRAAQAGELGEMPLAMIYQDQNKQKDYRPLSEEDIRLFQEAQAVQKKYDNDVPDEDLAEELGIRRYGFSRWEDFFNARQAVALAAFCRNIRSAYNMMLAQGMEIDKAKIITTYLGLSLDNLASSTSTLCRWMESQEAISNMFVYPDFWMPWSFAEANPFGPNNRWDQSLSRMKSLSKQLNFPKGWSAFVDQGTATDLKYPDNFFDAIVTDPPYYDNVNYANLSDFFYVWLKRSIGFLYPNVFKTPLTPKDDQIIEKRDATFEKISRYEQLLLKALHEMERTLKNDGVLTIIYPYRSQAAFVTILNLLLKAGFITIATWPIRTEKHVFLQTETADSQASLLIVCKKLNKEPEKSDHLRVRAVMRKRVRQQLEIFEERQIPISDYFLSAIGPALEVFGQYEITETDSGHPKDLSDLLSDIQGEVLEFSLVQEYNKRDSESPTDITFYLAKGLIRHRVRKQLANFSGENIWSTSFFIDRIDLSAEVFDYQNARKDNLQRIEVHELLEIVENEFRDFILLEDLQRTVELAEPAVKIKCETCKKEYLINETSLCPICHHPNLYQIAIRELTELSTQPPLQSDDPIVRQVFAKTERWGIENAYIRVVMELPRFRG
jgi:adenine-specific DNA methylase